MMSQLFPGLFRFCFQIQACSGIQAYDVDTQDFDDDIDLIKHRAFLPFFSSTKIGVSEKYSCWSPRDFLVCLNALENANFILNLV